MTMPFSQERVSFGNVYVELRTINVRHCTSMWISCVMKGRIRGDRPEGSCHTRFCRKLVKKDLLYFD